MGDERISGRGGSMDNEGMRHGPSKCPDCGAKPTSAWIDPGKCGCGRTMNPSQHTNISFKPKSNDRAFRTGWSVAKSPCAIEKGGKICPTCGLDDDTLSITGCPMKQGM